MEPIAVWDEEAGVWRPALEALSCELRGVWSEIFPPSGMTANGLLYPLPVWEPPTGAAGSSSSASAEGPVSRGSAPSRQERPLFATPTSNLGTCGGSQPPEKRRAGGHSVSLADEVEHLGA